MRYIPVFIGGVVVASVAWFCAWKSNKKKFENVLSNIDGKLKIRK